MKVKACQLRRGVAECFAAASRVNRGKLNLHYLEAINYFDAFDFRDPYVVKIRLSEKAATAAKNYREKQGLPETCSLVNETPEQKKALSIINFHNSLMGEISMTNRTEFV